MGIDEQASHRLGSHRSVEIALDGPHDRPFICLAEDVLVTDWIPQDDPVRGDTELADLGVMGARA